MLKKSLIIGAGGVGRVVAFKCAMNSSTFGEITLASRTKSKCDKIAQDIKEKIGVNIFTAQVDADNVDEVVSLIKQTKADIVINVALPYQDLTIMDGCIATATDYLDTANYEHRDTAKFEYKEQWQEMKLSKKLELWGFLGVVLTLVLQTYLWLMLKNTTLMRFTT